MKSKKKTKFKLVKTEMEYIRDQIKNLKKENHIEKLSGISAYMDKKTMDIGIAIDMDRNDCSDSALALRKLVKDSKRHGLSINIETYEKGERVAIIHVKNRLGY